MDMAKYNRFIFLLFDHSFRDSRKEITLRLTLTYDTAMRNIRIGQSDVRADIRSLDVRKTGEPDDIKNCATALSPILTQLCPLAHFSGIVPEELPKK